MNVIIVIDELDMGGAQHIVYLLAKHLDKERFAITIICTDGRREQSRLEQQMLQECDINRYKIIFLKNRVYVESGNPIAIFRKCINKIHRIISDIARIRELYCILTELRPDIIHAHQHGIWAVYWAIVHNVQVITTVHTTPNVTFPCETEKFALHLSLFFHRNVFVAISAYNTALIKSFWHLDEACVRTINNGIEITQYYQEPHDEFAFINVSRQDENKNQALILRAFARLYQENPAISMQVYLVGDGECHTALKQQSCALNIPVIFTGYIPSAVEYLSISDVYISSSHREGLSLSVLEAMASHLPIIATDVGGVRDLAQKNGILIADNDENGLYQAMKLLKNNPDIRHKMGQKSYEMVRAYNAKNMTAQYGALYKKLAQHS
ncbi:glycosyltransferase family 4 protein [Treponema endosymbiont of Eucomonympha sp.]|uniref:glycosyltransferase family 4 protein n=1 Tax=Treponema endosymbiont of Eucomonympha sp. TaxID=1580831 RepID=UPI00075144A4|nr:glycosyltransferase family 4 protein [Treponema endosymbiont of Eucomonympha sp.]